ncbi:polysaccharide deacetylase family protein [Marinigracilibium pacificum]|uniref:Polysaccharide deacetylase family protein n=1 Tax=Marinigracilibium pacificum TaxID=2729599 RepID=A0A848IWI4_9BACT|nr:polysaccharide deacetylase family protein [Marinigracilibium pacificum]NMM48036.1 polysaccharide deacetylase family protein [Marinigracilibium pacificum]
MENKGVFTISLDFELIWGGFEKWNLAKLQKYFMVTRKIIPDYLKLFEDHETHVTWATVGLLFADGIDQAQEYFPTELPSYRSLNLSAYNYIKQNTIRKSENEDPFHFAQSLVKLIEKVPGQEMATHTFSHYYCNEPGQTPGQFRADLQAHKAIAHTLGIELKSLVFPRNQFNETYLTICKEEGITSVRSNPVDWFWNIDTHNEPKIKRLVRGLDAFFPIGKKSSYKLDSIDVSSKPYLLPASRLLRAWSPKEAKLNRFKIDKIKKEMTVAAKYNEVYHLWWHPHNFGHFPDENLRDLKEILEHFKFLKKEYGMTSFTMNETSRLLDKVNNLAIADS